MTMDDMHGMMLPVPSLSERLADRAPAQVIVLRSQYLGNRIISRFYPEHWAKVQVARDNVRRYAE